jgi:sugar lactone lactonase YvrE
MTGRRDSLESTVSNFSFARRAVALLAVVSLAHCDGGPSPDASVDSALDVDAPDALVRDGASFDGALEDGALDSALTDAARSDDATDGSLDDGAPTVDVDPRDGDVAPPRGTVEVVAGSTATGYLDGVGTSARFSGPSGAVLSADRRTIFVADTFNALLRAVDVTTGAVSTIAGRLQVQSVVDGVGADARFQSPRAMALSPDGASLYVADGPTVRRVSTTTFAVTTLAGTPGMSGYADGSGASVRFGFLLHSFELSADGRTLYIADRSNRVLRTLDLTAAPMTGEVRTVAGTRYTGAEVHADGVGSAARFSGLGGILRIGGLLYVADTFNHVLRAVDLETMMVRTLVGRAGAAGVEDGPPSDATLDAPQSLTTDGANLYVTSFQGIVRRVALSDLRVSTPVGRFEEVFARDGDAMTARLGVSFGPPLCDPIRRVLYLNDRDASSLRVIDLSTFAVSTLAGSQDPSLVRDGRGPLARFDGASELVVSADGRRAFTADSSGRTVRELDLRTMDVRVIAGAFGVAGSSDGALGEARFGAPTGLAFDEVGQRLFVSDATFNTIRELDLRAGRSRTLAGDAAASGSTDGAGSVARFNGPSRLCAIGATLYVADSGNRSLRAIDLSSGVVSTVAGSASSAAATIDGPLAAARFRSVSGLACDARGRTVYVSDATAHTVRAVDLGAGLVRTVTGRDGVRGPADGPLSDALFNGPRGLWLATSGALYVADQSNHSVRRVDLTEMRVTTFVGSPSRNGGLVAGRRFAIDDATLYFPSAVVGLGEDLLVLAEDALYVVRPRGGL